MLYMYLLVIYYVIGSCERYMVGYQVGLPSETSQQPAAGAQLVAQCAAPPAQPLPPTGVRAGADPEAEVVELQTMLGDAINRIVKFHHKSLNEKISWAHLMCGEFSSIFF